MQLSGHLRNSSPQSPRNWSQSIYNRQFDPPTANLLKRPVSGLQPDQDSESAHILLDQISRGSLLSGRRIIDGGAYSHVMLPHRFFSPLGGGAGIRGPPNKEDELVQPELFRATPCSNHILNHLQTMKNPPHRHRSAVPVHTSPSIALPNPFINNKLLSLQHLAFVNMRLLQRAPVP